MKNFKLKQITVAIIILFIILFNTIGVYAAGGDGSGTGGGDGSGSGDKPLGFVSCTLDDGTSSGGKIDAPGGITINPKFKLQFDKNVVNDLVWINNSKCISLVMDNNFTVPIYVSKIDDTVDPSKKQIIYVRPAKALQSGKTYYIKVAPGLEAKNQQTLDGSTNGKGITISFNTIKDATAASNPTETPTASGTNTKAPKVVASKGQEVTKNIFNSLSLNNWIAIVTVIFIVLWIVIEINLKRKSRKERNIKP